MPSYSILKRSAPIAVITLMVMAVQILALALMSPLSATEVRVFEDPESVTNPFVYIILVLAFTLFILLAMRMKKGWIVELVILMAVAMSVFYVLVAFLAPLPALVISLVILLLLHVYPEWYVIDLVGLLVCAGVSTLFGLSMTPLPAILLLTVLAVYDAISVYKTHHMVSLAEGVMKIKSPLLFIVPWRQGYSFRKDAGGKDRGAYFLGLGDAIIPTVLVISANWFLAAPRYDLGGGIGVNTPALGAMLGTYLGFVLLSLTPRDKPQAGLPFLNGGAVVGFLLGSLVAGVWPF